VWYVCVRYVSVEVGWEWRGVKVEEEVVCVERGAGGGTLFITPKYNFAGWQGGQMTLEVGKI